MKTAIKRKIYDNLISYVFLLPVILGILIFALFPIIMSVSYSFSDYNGGFATKFGLFNYEALFDTSDIGYFIPVIKSFGITFLYVIISISVMTVLSYMLALFLRKEIRGTGLIRLLCYSPCLIPGFIGSFIWRDVFSYSATGDSNGIINGWLTQLGFSPFPFFSSSDTAMFSLIFSGLWGVGGGMIMLLAAFGNISPELYEAADIDGAGYFTKLFRLTVPLSTPIIFYNLVVALISGLQIFGTFGAYGTGPDESLYFITIRIYRNAFENNRYGIASAMSFLLFGVIALLTTFMFKINKWVHYGDE